jgi:hypothetical protein
MTQHVRTSYKKHRKTTWGIVLLVAIVGALIATVIPATGAPGDPTGLRSDPLGVQPIEDPSGGSTYTCPQQFNQFQINNPKTGTYSTTVSGVPVSFTLTISGGGPTTKDKYLSFRSNIAAVGIVAIKGGTKTALYTYSSPALADGYGSGTTNPLTVDVDGTNGKIGLHAPVDSSGSPYSVSYTTFCFNLPIVHPSCTEPFSGLGIAGTGTATYSAQLVANNGCKSDDVIMYSYTPGTNQLFATLYPLTPGGTKYQVVEHIHETGISGSAQNPITLKYDDVAPYDGVDTPGIAGNDGFRIMRMCGSDPRSDPESFDLGGATPAMPPDDADGAHTTCMLTNTFSAGSGPTDRTYDAWLYSRVDGTRGH